MATTDFVMPKLGLTMTEGTIARWDVAPGKNFAQELRTTIDGYVRNREWWEALPRS